MTLEEKATYMSTFFTTKTVDRGVITIPKPEAPDYVTDFCRFCHNDAKMLPDNHRYEMIVEALEAIVEEVEFVEPPIYYAQMTGWLSSHLERLGYCDEAMKEGGGPYTSITDILQAGWMLEFEEVRQQVTEWLTNNEVESAT